MRLKITAVTDKPCTIPYNYQYQLQSAIYNIFRNSDVDFSKFLHDTGYTKDEQYKYKLFTFSYLKTIPYHTNKNGFFLVKKIEFIFSTAIDKNFEHLMHGIFPKADLILKFKQEIKFKVVNVQLLSQPEFNDNKQKFICLSPLVVSTQRVLKGKKAKYFLNWFNDTEKEKYKQNLKMNLLRKYEVINHKPYEGDLSFNFGFDTEYITTKAKSIKKMIKFNNTFIIALFAPFYLQSTKELKEIAYDAGLGEQNSAGFGCIDIVKDNE